MKHSTRELEVFPVTQSPLFRPPLSRMHKAQNNFKLNLFKGLRRGRLHLSNIQVNLSTNHKDCSNKLIDPSQCSNPLNSLCGSTTFSHKKVSGEFITRHYARIGIDIFFVNSTKPAPSDPLHATASFFSESDRHLLEGERNRLHVEPEVYQRHQIQIQNTRCKEEV